MPDPTPTCGDTTPHAPHVYDFAALGVACPGGALPPFTETHGNPRLQTPYIGPQPGQTPPQTAAYTPGPVRHRAARRRWLPWAAAAAALLIGVGIGVAGQPDPEVRTVAGPVRVVEKPGPTVTETVEVTPPACARALDLAERGLRLSADALTIAGEAFAAISRGDVAELQAASGRLDAVNTQIGKVSPRYQAAAAQCRAAR